MQILLELYNVSLIRREYSAEVSSGRLGNISCRFIDIFMFNPRFVKEVIPKKILNVPYPPVGTPTSEVSPLCSLSWAKRVKRLPLGYRHSGEGSGGGVPLPAKGFWDNLKDSLTLSRSLIRD